MSRPYKSKWPCYNYTLYVVPGGTYYSNVNIDNDAREQHCGKLLFSIYGPTEIFDIVFDDDLWSIPALFLFRREKITFKSVALRRLLLINCWYFKKEIPCIRVRNLLVWNSTTRGLNTEKMAFGNPSPLVVEFQTKFFIKIWTIVMKY